MTTRIFSMEGRQTSYHLQLLFFKIYAPSLLHICNSPCGRTRLQLIQAITHTNVLSCNKRNLCSRRRHGDDPGNQPNDHDSHAKPYEKYLVNNTCAICSHVFIIFYRTAATAGQNKNNLMLNL